MKPKKRRGPFDTDKNTDTKLTEKIRRSILARKEGHRDGHNLRNMRSNHVRTWEEPGIIYLFFLSFKGIKWKGKCWAGNRFRHQAGEKCLRFLTSPFHLPYVCRYSLGYVKTPPNAKMQNMGHGQGRCVIIMRVLFPNHCLCTVLRCVAGMK